MHYFAKLKIGETYIVKGINFKRGEEVAVNQDVYEYLETVVEDALKEDNGKFYRVKYPRFDLRTEELTREEKIVKEVESVPDISPRPNKPGPKPKEKTEE